MENCPNCKCQIDDFGDHYNYHDNRYSCSKPMSTKSSTPETDAFAKRIGAALANNRRDIAKQAEQISLIIDEIVGTQELELIELRRVCDELAQFGEGLNDSLDDYLHLLAGHDRTCDCDRCETWRAYIKALTNYSTLPHVLARKEQSTDSAIKQQKEKQP